MSAPEQLTMFEPTGDELARLARRHARNADASLKAAHAMRVRGMEGTARMYEGWARDFEAQAAQCETALQLEQEAGL